MPKSNIIGERLYRLRSGKKLTIKQLSKALNISTGHISELESGKSMPTIHTLNKICDFFGTNLIGYFIDSPVPITLSRKQMDLINLTKHIDDAQLEYLNKFIESLIKSKN